MSHRREACTSTVRVEMIQKAGMGTTSIANAPICIIRRKPVIKRRYRYRYRHRYKCRCGNGCEKGWGNGWGNGCEKGCWCRCEIILWLHRWLEDKNHKSESNLYEYFVELFMYSDFSHLHPSGYSLSIFPYLRDSFSRIHINPYCYP